MKKTLVALTVAAFAATSASAATIYDNEGTTVEFGGQLRVLLSQEGSKTKNGNTTTVTKAHSNLNNNGSRFHINVKHNISDNLYGLGYYETRFGAGAESGDAGWGAIETEKAYVGLGGYGHQVTFGKQTVIGDDIGQAGFDKKYDVGSSNIKGGFGILTASSNSAVNYTYTGVEGLTLGANYNFANDRDSKGEVNASYVNADGKTVNPTKSGFGLGAVYQFNVAEGQKATVSAGYTHDDYKVAPGAKEKNKDGIYFGAKYQVDALTVAVDGGRGVVKQGADKTKLNFVRTGARYEVTNKAGVYGNYSYGTTKVSTATSLVKNTAHQFMLGSEYKLHKQVVTFVEGRIIKNKDNATAVTKKTDKAVGVGLRVFF